MNTSNETDLITMKDKIRARLTALTNTDGLKRTQRWLANSIKMGEVELSNKINNDTLTQDDLDKINHVLSTDFKVVKGTE